MNNFFLISLNPVTVTRDYTAKQNLGQTYNGIPRYCSKTDDGKPTGVGYAFEDLARRRWENSGMEVEQVPAELNGPDFILDRVDVQLKCGKTPYASGNGFYRGHNNKCPYTDQVGVVPEGHGSGAKRLCEMRDKNLGLGKPLDVIEAPVTRQEAEVYGSKGYGSFMMDFTDSNLVKPAVFIGACTAVGGLTVDLIRNRKKLSWKMACKKALKWIGLGTIVGIGALASECAYRQRFRP